MVIDLQAIYAEMAAKLPEGMMEVNADMRSGFFGIEDAWCTEAVVYSYNTGVELAEVWMVKTTDADSLNALEDLARNRIRSLDEESATYSAEMNAMIKKAEVIIHDEYLAMIIAPESAALAGIFRAAVGA